MNFKFIGKNAKLIAEDYAGYSKQDGSPDRIGDIILSSRVFAVALAHILKDNEGIVIDLPKQDDYPDEIHGKFIVNRHDNQIKATLCETEEELAFKDGTWVWLQD